MIKRHKSAPTTGANVLNISGHFRFCLTVLFVNYNMIVYDPLWRTLKEKNISQYKLIKEYNFSTGQLDRLRKNGNVSTYTLNVLCEILDCSLNDIVAYKKTIDAFSLITTKKPSTFADGFSRTYTQNETDVKGKLYLYFFKYERCLNAVTAERTFTSTISR